MAWTAKRLEPKTRPISLQQLNPPVERQASRNHGVASLFLCLASLPLVYREALKCRVGAKKGVRKMGQRQTETYLDTRAIYSEAEYLSAILLWLQGYSGPLGGVPKALISEASHEIADENVWGDVVIVPSCVSARSSYE